MNIELYSLEGTRCQFNGGTGAIKSAVGRMRPVCALGIDVHQDFYVVVMQEGGSNPKPPQRFSKQAFHTKATGIRSLKIQNRKTERRFEGNSSF